jgi:hypothetical protein
MNPDHDGISNLMEWALRLTATQPDTVKASIPAVSGKRFVRLKVARPWRIGPLETHNHMKNARSNSLRTRGCVSLNPS